MMGEVLGQHGLKEKWTIADFCCWWPKCPFCMLSSPCGYCLIDSDVYIRKINEG